MKRAFFLFILFLFWGNVVWARSGVSTEDFQNPRDLQLADEIDHSTVIDVLELKDMDILDVLKLIAQKSGLNIIAEQEVRGKVTVFLRDVDVHEALKTIVKAYGWAYTQDGNIVRVMTGKKYEEYYGSCFGQEIETAVFALSYAGAQQMASKLSEILTPEKGRMKYDERSNRILVTDTARKIEEVRALVNAFDQKDKEVLIEAKIVQVVLSDEHKFGVDWGAVVSDFHDMNLTSRFGILGGNEKKGMAHVGTLAADGYVVLLEALESVGHTEILSSPRITVVNNKEAKILVGSTEPYVTTTTSTPSSGPTIIAESVNFIEVGIKLFVTPTIHEDDFITMKIKPEVSSVVNNITTSNGNTIPIVETSEAETMVVVKNNVTIVMGGMIKEEKIKTVHKIPILGDIPVLGMAFRNKGNLTRKTEMVIFLTPRIISGDVDDEEWLAAFE